MENGFWSKLKTPILAVAPMYDITDTAFRQVIAACGKPSVFFTEFVSVDGLTNPKSKAKLTKYLLQFNEIERPIVAQIWGIDPKKFYEAAKIITELGFDGIDINMGCPDKAVIKMGAGSALILNPKLAQEIISETKRGACSADGKTVLPVSVKTRLGYTTNIISEWLPYLLEAKPAAITIHGRTMKQMSKVPADWNAIAEAKQIVKDSETLILGNGDIRSLEDAHEKIKICGIDGVMIGRGVLGNPWFFNKEKNESNITQKERFEVLQMHINLFEKYFKNFKNFHMLKKHIKSHISGFDGAKEIRAELMNAKTLDELKSQLENLTPLETFNKK